MKRYAKQFATCGAVLLMVSQVGCGEDLERPSDVSTLRVLAVQAESPFARPGAEVALRMLAHDGSPGARMANGERRSATNLWLGGCNNPAGDSYVACMPYLHEIANRLGEAELAQGSTPADVPSGVVGWGEAFQARIPADMISSRKRAPGTTHGYGVQIAFFANCAGVLRASVVDRTKFPLGCFDRETGKELGRDDYEYGFYPVFVYDSLNNQNPELQDVTFDGHAMAEPCDESQNCLAGEHCGVEGRCIPTVPRCKDKNADSCQSYDFSIRVPSSAAEPATAAYVSDSDAMLETLWVSYFANGGSFEQDSRIVHDPHSGWGSDTGGRWRANLPSSREVRLWAILRDNRNGVSWAWRDVWVE